jgi:hypothetical protein
LINDNLSIQQLNGLTLQNASIDDLVILLKRPFGSGDHGLSLNLSYSFILSRSQIHDPCSRISRLIPLFLLAAGAFLGCRRR